MKIYCRQCGSAVHYNAGSKPNFCQKCGVNLSIGAAPIETDNLAPEEEEVESRVTDWRLGGLEVDIENDNAKVYKFEDVVGTLSSPNPDAPQGVDNDFISPKPLSQGATF